MYQALLWRLDVGEFLITYLRGGGGSGGKSCPTLAIPWTGVHDASLSKGFSRQEYWSGLPFPSPGIFLTQGSNPRTLSFCRVGTIAHSLHIGKKKH